MWGNVGKVGRLGVGGARAEGRMQETRFWVHVSSVDFATKNGTSTGIPCVRTRRWHVSSEMGSVGVGAGVSRRCVNAASLMFRRKGLFEAVLVYVEGGRTFINEISVNVGANLRVTEGLVAVCVLRDVRAMARSSVLLASASADSL